MKRELVGITFALSIGLYSSAFAAVPLLPSLQWDAWQPVRYLHLHYLNQDFQKQPVQRDYQSLAMALPSGEGLLDASNFNLLAVAKPMPKVQASKETPKKVPLEAPKVKTAKSLPSNALLNQGIQAYNRGFISKAIPYFARATQQNPKDEMAFLWLARAYQKQGSQADFAKAKQTYQQVLALNPNQVEALSNLGEMWSWDPAMRGDAIGLLRKANDLQPTNAAISKKLAEALFWKGNALDALRYAAPIAQQYKTDRKFMGEYAQMLSLTGHADEALRIYDTVLQNNTVKALPLKLDQARAFLGSGQKQKAQALYEEVISQAAQANLLREPEFLQNLAGLSFDLGQYTETLKWDQALPASLQQKKDVQLRDARALKSMFRVPEAIDRFQRLYEAGLLNANEKLEYAEYLKMQHLAPEAMPLPNLLERLYTEAAQEAPDNSEVTLKTARLYAEDPARFQDAVSAYQQALSNPTLENPQATQREFLDYIKTDKTQPAMVEGIFQNMLADSPNNIMVLSAYAEYLSWQPTRRMEALKQYIALAKSDSQNSATWESHIEDILKWQTPSTDSIPVYQELVNLYPQNKTIWLTIARAYRNDKNYYKEAVETYSTLVKNFPNDDAVKREWLGLLLADNGQRDENLRLLKKMTEEAPNDLDVLATYGKLLSYNHQYGPAMDAFEKVLGQNPQQRDALVGKGYVILWSGKKLAAKSYFQELRKQYPDDVDIAIGLAQTEKMIGRYDEAMKIIQEIKPLMDQRSGQEMQTRPQSGYYQTESDFQPVIYMTPKLNVIQSQAVWDYSILPGTLPSDAEQKQTSDDAGLLADASAGDVDALRSDIDALSDAVASIKQLQQSSRHQLDQLNASIKVTKDAVPDALDLQGKPDETSAFALGNDTALQSGGTLQAKGASVGEGMMTKRYGTYTALDYDTNPLLSGMGRFKNEDLDDLEKGLKNELRPMIRSGFLYSRQGGNGTTTRLSSWGFPNQVSFSLTPQVRLRAAFRPGRYYLPRGIAPDSTSAFEYGFGGTLKYWDRLTLDGDLAFTHFGQSQSTNVTFQTQAQYDINDSIRAKIGMSRLPQYTSLLTLTGLRPSLGAFRNDLVGQARENSIYAELNTNPFTPNWDWNLGYAWAWVDGSKIPTNYKNQAFTSLGYTWHYTAKHQVRLGYEFLYFGYSKNATNGYFDTTAAGLRQPVANLQPLTLANSNYVFGGYYSPHVFIMNAGRLDFRGSLFNKFLEYKLGGSLGAQSVSLGHGIHEKGNGTSLSKAFDSNIILNFTDWLAAYGDVDYLSAGGQFNRWRFGGGLIVRPHIEPLSPIFGPKSSPLTKR